ncbi:MAG TPA: pentapeptide repeat-containing protein [Gemmataceae bacterium]|nr:pentapeptide repeat-containing protein [Gemmataceae bacterium]
MSTTPRRDESTTYHVPRQAYERLAAASPVERAELVLGLIEEHPQGRLELPVRDGLQGILDGVDLSRVALEGRQGRAPAGVPWWDAERRGAGLCRADLRGAGLSLANLQAADLAEADLRQALLRGTNLQGARLEEANLQGADLAGADLRGAVLGGADLGGAMLEDANLQGASLRFVHGPGAVLETANLQGADLWGARLEGAVLARADLQKAILTEADLRGADLAGADLRGAVLAQADLRGARLQGIDLRGAILTRVNFEGAVLKDAKLQGMVLSDCNLTHVHISGAAIEKTQFRREQLGDAIGEDLAGRYEEARRGYLALERHFSELGDSDAVSWAYRKRRRMQKRVAREEARAARARRDWRGAAAWYAKYAGDQLTEWLSDYGESVPRVLRCMLIVYILFLLLYGLTGSVVRVEHTPTGMSRVPTRGPADLAVFSLFSMITSAQPPVGLLPADEYARLLTGVHALLGWTLTGLLGFVLGNRMRG